ncbi:RNA polymerase sigma factor [Leisingera sp. F5]|uniref:RNA polymerase sigma factor n=1 Tax=Leisingera sp. F5 TaxID=1813816 RepID=UPI0025BF95A2|nr:RNA polymerase sigma factor [Leisingera sp. F5]
MSPLYPRLWRFCLMQTGRRDRADDLAQMTCLRALEKHAGYQAGTHLDRWLFRIAHRLWLNELRATAVRTGGGLVALEETEIPDQRVNTETNIFARQVFSKVGELPESQRVTVLLVYVEGFAYKEAAEILNIPIGTVMSRLAAARKKIAGELAETETGT